MTYTDYINETRENCLKVLSELSDSDIQNTEKTVRFLATDDRVTGVYSEHCTSMKGNAEDNIKDVIFDEEFLNDFNGNKMDMQDTMAHGPEAVDAIVRYLAIKHISIIELIEQEKAKRRLKREKTARDNSVRT